ncbi:unnamed protein product [Clonostachys rhizophaga]|uniref:Protein kinase domain-containing protein n=1 Tax=Clonostachys rhizophaga TaxID=160324 RepID=A0A9N9YQY0_9HYPO|nr:unnamed protein product [Clonostachys rhizophaga]
MVVHNDAHEHLPREDEVPSLVFLKTYEERYHSVYHLERKSNSAFASEEIAPCIGSFHWFDENKGRTSTLVFQYAEHGTLLDLYRQSLPPYLPEHVKAFWEGISGVLKGLHTIHDSVGSYTGLHHDMKPSNILVFSNGLLDDKFVYQFKIGDFGASYLIPSNVNLQPINRGTTRTYAPPEIYLGDSVKYVVGSTLDMWSIGCIIFEAAVWLVCGERGRQDFRRKRLEEISRLTTLKNLGYGDCFHNRSVALECIAEYADLMKLHGRQSDEITRQIVKLATKNLLVVRDSRINSLNLYTRFGEILDDEHLPEVRSPTYLMDVDQTRSLSTVRSGMPQRIQTGQPLRGEPGKISPLETSEDENISKMSTPGSGSAQPLKPEKLTKSIPISADETEVHIDRLSSWIKAKKTQKHNDELPGWKLVQGQLKGRDFKYEEEVLRWVSKLGYLVKELDPDGGEIRCTSDHNKTVKFTSSTEAEKFVSEKFADGKGGPCDMENALFGVVDSIRGAASTVSSRLSFLKRSGSGPKKTTVLVFTDGVWDSSIESGVMGADEPIESLIKHMKKKDIGRPNISIQFLRFGSDPVGIRRLESLDDDLGQKHEL